MSMRTALSVVADFRMRAGLSVPSTVVLAPPYTTVDPDIAQLVGALIEASEQARDTLGFVEQKRKIKFQTVAGQRVYPMPADYFAPVLDTKWDQTRMLKLEGPLSDSEFACRLYGGQSSTEYAFKIYVTDTGVYYPIHGAGGAQIVLDPAPSSVQTISLEYYSSWMFLPKGWQRGTAYTVGVKIFANGCVFTCTTSGTSAATGTGPTPPEFYADSFPVITDGTAQWSYANTYTGETILQDTDLCVFPADVLLLGLRAKIRSEQGGDPSISQADFEKRLSRARSRNRGPVRGNSCRNTDRGRYTTQTKGWSI